jgi:hypothetical protein
MLEYYENAEYYRSQQYAEDCPTFEEAEASYDVQSVLLFQQLAAHIPYGLASDIALDKNEDAWIALNGEEIQIAGSIYNRIMGIDQ